eukprot:s1941_g5.t1
MQKDGNGGDQRQGKVRRKQRKRQAQRRKARAADGLGGERQEVIAEKFREQASSEVLSGELTEGGAGCNSRPACDPASASGTVLLCSPLEPTGTGGMAEKFSLKGKTFGEVAILLSSMFSSIESSMLVSRSKVQSSGGIFPLPDCPRALGKVIGHFTSPQLEVLSGVCKALNSYRRTPGVGKPLVSAATRSASETLAANLNDSGLCGEKFEGLSWDRLMDVQWTTGGKTCVLLSTLLGDGEVGRVERIDEEMVLGWATRLYWRSWEIVPSPGDKDPYDDVKGLAVDAACALAFSLQSMLKQGYTMGQVQHPDDEVYQRFTTFLRSNMDFQGISGRVSCTIRDAMPMATWGLEDDPQEMMDMMTRANVL